MGCPKGFRFGDVLRTKAEALSQLNRLKVAGNMGGPAKLRMYFLLKRGLGVLFTMHDERLFGGCSEIA